MTVRTIRVEIAKPLNMTWDELGTILHTQRKVVRQLLRAGMDARIACGAVGGKAVKQELAPEAKGATSRAMVYQAMKLALVRIKRGKWPEACVPALEVCGSMLSAIEKRVMTDYGKRSSYNSAQPIPVRKQETSISHDKKGVTVTVKLVSSGSIKLACCRSKGGHWHALQQIASGEIKHGACSIVRCERKKKWYILLSYDKPLAEPLTVDPARALVVHRGIHHALTMLPTAGQRVFYESGEKLFAQLGRLEARMRHTRSVSPNVLGDGAKGHGKTRRYAHYDMLMGKRKRVVHTWCQQMASMVVRRAHDQGCGLIVIEKYGGIEPHPDDEVRRKLTRFPLYQLKLAIVQTAEIANMVVSEAPAEYISTTCVICGNQDDRQHNKTTGAFHCAACRFSRPADFVAVLHMGRRSGVDMSAWNDRLDKEQKILEKLKKEEEDDEKETNVRNDSRRAKGSSPRSRQGRRKTSAAPARRRAK